MSLVAMGASFKTVDLETLGRASVPEKERAAALRQLIAFEGVSGAVLLSTCNRVEAYVDAQTDRVGVRALAEFFRARLAGGASDGGGAVTGTPDPTEGVDGLRPGFYVKRGEGVVHHLFRVASSLDSLVLGEAQVLGQVRAAYGQASNLGACGDVLGQLFRDAISLGKRVRTETAIGDGSVSLSTAAVKAAQNAFPDLPSRRVLVIGSGNMARLALSYLRDRGVSECVVTSRTHSHARTLACAHDARAIRFEDRYEALNWADIAFCATSAPSAVVAAADLSAVRASSDRRLVLVDEALPCDVEPACGALPGVEIYDLEALNTIADDGLVTRLAAVGDVERLIDGAQVAFLLWMQQRSVIPTVKVMYEKGAAIVAAEAEKAARELARAQGAELAPDQRAILAAFGTAVMKKVLHGPTARLKKEASTADSYYYTGAARYLFGIDAYPPGSPPRHGHPGESPVKGGGPL